jgi:MFS family permease
MFLVILFVPETSYDRPQLHEILSTDIPEKDLEGIKSSTEGKEIDEPPNALLGSSEPKMSYLSSLRIYTGIYSRSPLWKIMVRPFIMFFYPCVLWGFLIYGTTLTWIVVFSVVNGVIFVSPPYNFSVAQTGLTGLSPFILSIIGEIISGPLNDWMCLHLAKRNRGVYEPEFRLVLMSVVVVLGTVGFFGFGLTVHYVTNWSGPVVTYGLANMALAFAAPCVFGYVVDCFPKLSEEAFVAINARNFLTFGLTYFVNDWLAKDGAEAVFNVLGSCFLAVCALTIPLWVFGKKIRGKTARIQWLQKFMHD